MSAIFTQHQKIVFEDGKMNQIKLALIALVAMVATSCATTGQVSNEAPVSVGEEYAEYRLGVGDMITVNVWRNLELSLAVPVRPDGKISLPLVGDVQAAELTTAELSKSLQEELVNFIRNPQVTVIVTDATSTNFQRRVRVTGAVEAPLSIPYRKGMTVLDLVLEAQGPSEFAVPNKAKLYRHTDTGVKTYNIRLGDILNKGKLSTNYEIAPSDIITVPERVF
ncbi:MAG: polysaccharide export outer membrane protein [Flavobacteriales bacterium]